MSKAKPTRLRFAVGGNRMSRVRTCVTQKVGYATKSEALDAAEIAMEAGHCNPGCHITPYQCPECKGWHIANRVIVKLNPHRVGKDNNRTQGLTRKMNEGGIDGK